jgi:hypothetical protein
LSEEDLILHHYGESAGDPHADAHLAECAACRASLLALRGDLEALGEGEVPERGDDYAEQVWERLRPRLQERPGRLLAFRARYSLPAAIAASLILAFLAGRHTAPPLPSPAPREVVRERVRERILLVAVGDHLERSRMVLIELMNADGGSGAVDVSAEREKAVSLVANNRLYRQTAARAGEGGVASVLDELERMLLEVANGPDRLEPDRIQAIRERIESKGLIFKIQVLGSQVRERRNLPRRAETRAVS